MAGPSDAVRVGVIDLGSNTARLVVYRAIPGFAYRLEDEIREVVRLRQGMTEQGLSEEAVARAFSTLRLFKRFCETTVDLILPTATSAVREAANGPAFVRRVAEEIGLELRILEGEQEAYYGVLGALNEVPMTDGVVLDIGGGSAQVSEVRGGRFQRGQALTLGALALTERFIRSDPASAKEVSEAVKEIRRQLKEVTWLADARNPTLVGLGGTIRNLARIAAEAEAFPLKTLHGYRLTQKALSKIVDGFLDKPVPKRSKIPGLNPDRADIITAGALVLRQVMETLEVPEIRVSHNGLREGVFFEQFWKHLPYPVIPDIRRFSVLNLARVYQYRKDHVNHVRFLAGRLFEQLQPLHGMGPGEREILDAAAMLHDIGSIVGYEDHHKHSQTLVEYNGLPGYTPREIALVGLTARYHRKGAPSLADHKSLLDASDLRTLQCLSAILRMSEFLERGRKAAVDDVTARWDEGTLHLTLIADEHPAVEIWEAERNAVELMTEVFGRKVALASIAAPPETPNRRGDEDSPSLFA